MDLLKLQDCPSFLKDFLFYMESIKGRSAKTVEAYYIDLRLFLRFLQMKFSGRLSELDMIEQESIAQFDPELLKKVTLSDAYEFLNYVLSGRSNNSATRARKVSSMRSFFKYLTTKTNYLTVNPVLELEVPSIRKSLPRYLSLDESKKLLNNSQISSQTTPEPTEITADAAPQESVIKASSSQDTFIQTRDYCILTLFLNCGMRLSELVGINISDLGIQCGEVHSNALRILGKGNKERQIYLNLACLSSIQEYLPYRAQVAAQRRVSALFLSRRGTRLTPRRVEQIVTEHLKQAGLDGKGYSAHKLRHTAATLLYQYGKVDIRALQEILGHSNLSTTQIYTHVSDDQLRSAMERSPLSGEMTSENQETEEDSHGK